MTQIFVEIQNLVKPIKSYDWITKNDLYVVVKYGEQVAKTSTKWNDDNPRWNEKFLFDKDETIQEI